MNKVVGKIAPIMQVRGGIRPVAQITGEIQPTAQINVQITGIGPRGLPGAEYSHPDKHSAEIIEETADKSFISVVEKARLYGYIHDQQKAGKRWVIVHSLNKYPAVSIVDSGGTLVVGDIQYISKNQVEVTFTVEFSGKAYLS